MKLIISLLILLFSLPAFGTTLRIYHIDVEQGDATLFVAPNGKTLLVDSGRNGHGNRIKKVMEDAGVGQIDFFVDTHYHSDHYGGIDDLIEKENVTVVQAYDRGDKGLIPVDKIKQKTYKDYQRSIGEDAGNLTRGETIPLDPTMKVTCISSGGVVIGEEPPMPGNDENDVSISLLIAFGQFKYFIGGDIEKPTELKIAARDLVTNVDVYHSDHHGSHTSSTPAFMEDLLPTVIIISNGNSKKYQHPRQSTLDFYSTLPGPPVVYQTNKYIAGGSLGGNVPDEFIADPETSDQDGTILISVDSDTGKFTVSYTGNSGTTFNTKTLGSSSIIIESLIPNPVGSDKELEEVVLKNTGDSPVSMAGWSMKDKGGSVWPLVSMGKIAGGKSKAIHRNGMVMSLNNGGDVITLFDAQDEKKDEFSYHSSVEGVRINTGH